MHLRLRATLIAPVIFFLLLVKGGASGAPGPATGYTRVYNAVHPSVVLLVVMRPGATSPDYCSGSIIASDAGGSVVLTAAHCIPNGSDIRVHIKDDAKNSFRGRLLRIGNPQPPANDLDLALVAIEVPRLPILHVATQVEVGAIVVSVAFPGISISEMLRTGDLEPALHEGTVSVIRDHGRRIEYSAVTDPGSSGGPVVDANTGEIIAVSAFAGNFLVRGVYGGPGIIAIRDFASAADVGLNGKLMKPIASLAAIQNPSIGASELPSNLKAVIPWTQPGPQTATWSAFSFRAPLPHAPDVYEQMRCVDIGNDHLWQVRIVNLSRHTVTFSHRLTAQGATTNLPATYTLDNVKPHLLLPEALDAPCDASPLSDVSNVTFDQATSTPMSSVPTDLGPESLPAWNEFSKPLPLPQQLAQVARCLALDATSSLWQVEFSKTGAGAQTLDFDLEASGTPTVFRHRYLFPGPGTYYSDVFPLANHACTTPVATLTGLSFSTRTTGSGAPANASLTPASPTSYPFLARNAVIPPTSEGAQPSTWSYFPPHAVSGTPTLFEQLRCTDLGSDHVWESQIANRSTQTVSFTYRIDDTLGESVTEHYTLDNKLVYVTAPHVLNMPCSGNVTTEITNVSFSGQEQPPTNRDLTTAPTAVPQWGPFSRLLQLGLAGVEGVQFKLRCLPLTSKWSAWQAAFLNANDFSVSFDFNLQLSGVPTASQRRYMLEPSPTLRYSDVFLTRDSRCSSGVSAVTSNVVRSPHLRRGT